MRKYPCFLLANPDSEPQSVGARWGRGALLVLGRQFCVHFSLDATGVPARRVSGFVALQAARLTPFARFDGVFVRQGSQVQVWVWPQELVRSALARLGLGRGPWLVRPESLCGSVPTQGVIVRSCAQGVEALRFDAGQLLDAMWWPEPPGAQALGVFCGNVAAVMAEDSVLDRVRNGRIWAHAVRQVPVFSVGSTEQGAVPWFKMSLAWVVLGWAFLGLAGAYAGWAWASEQQMVRANIVAQTELDLLLVESARGTSGRAGAAQAEDVQWVNDIRRLTRGVRLDELLKQFEAPLAVRGLLIRELVIDKDELKLTLVSGYGGAVDLEEAIAALESVDLWQRVELIDFMNPAAARFGLKFKAALGMGGAV